MSSTSRKLMSIKNNNLRSVYSKAGNISDDEVLLLNQPKESDEIFRALEIPSKAEFINDQLKDIQSVKRYESLFEGEEVFIGSHIKDLCNKYFLQILKLSELKGYLPDETGLEIKKFIDKFDKALTQSSFYILAGRECFENDYYGKEVKTYIIFFIDPSDSRSYSKIEEDSRLVQLTSSGNDWSNNRTFLKHLDTKTYRAGFDMLISNIIGLGVPFIGIILGFIFKVYYLVLFMIFVSTIFFIVNHYFINNNFKKYWNEKYE